MCEEYIFNLISYALRIANYDLSFCILFLSTLYTFNSLCIWFLSIDIYVTKHHFNGIFRQFLVRIFEYRIHRLRLPSFWKLFVNALRDCGSAGPFFCLLGKWHLGNEQSLSRESLLSAEKFSHYLPRMCFTLTYASLASYQRHQRHSVSISSTQELFTRSCCGWRVDQKTHS